MKPASLRAKRSQAAGAIGERLALGHLRALGIEAERIETGWHVKYQGGQFVGAAPVAPVLADIVGVYRGRAVLVEVKLTPPDTDRLIWSRLDPHQIRNLDRWQTAGANVLVAWVRGLACLFVPWRAAPGWGPRHSLPWETALKLAWNPMHELENKS